MRVLKNNIINLYGKEGKEWLDALPELITQLAKTYGLSDLKPLQNLSYNYVLSAYQDSNPVIVKLGLDSDGLKKEARALKAFAGFGAIRVLAADEGMLLLERCMPGFSLKSYFPTQDDEAIRITCERIQALHKAPIPEGSAFPTISNWLSVLDNNWKIPRSYLEQARQLRDNLLQASSEKVLLHGDLHHENILNHGDQWVVIDPKGVLGDPVYEVAAFIRNPMPELLTLENAHEIISYRINRFAEILELPSKKIRDWCFVQAVLAWAWALDDGVDAKYFEQLTAVYSLALKH
ncbi:MAG: aminoglycoside phosphotransferase family protein [Legionella sp.]|nr:aminoglycoside phosphotransferase family protein [Legionella sp.]